MRPTSRVDPSLLSNLRTTCPCFFCRFPVDVQGEMCQCLSFTEFARLRSLSTCWKLRYQLYGPGKGILAFGMNGFGQLGDGTTTHRYRPTDLSDAVTALCPQQISMGLSHTLALTAHGAVLAWGANGNGQLGDGTMDGNRLTPVCVGGELASKHVTQIVGGAYFSLALTDKGEVYSWGRNSLGELGGVKGRERPLPARVNLGEGRVIVQISAGNDHALALSSHGEIFQWGANSYRSDDAPIKVGCFPAEERVVRVIAGAKCSYALTDQGNLYVWDKAAYTARIFRRITLPTEPSRIVQADASAHFLALTDQGEVYAWGNNAYGQVGDGTRRDRMACQKVLGLAHRHVVRVVCGVYHSLAVTDRGEIFGWGWNEFGQLGDGTRENRRTPRRLPCSALGAGATGALQIAAAGGTILWAC